MSDLFTYDQLPISTISDLSDQIELTTQLIGRGGCGSVYKGKWLDAAANPTATIIAIKIIELVPLRDEAKGKRRFKQIMRELSLWSSIKHENILPLLGIARINGDTNVPAFVCPWMENGNAREFCSQNPHFPPMRILYDIINGLHYLHTSQPEIVHGDIKAVNVLINNRCEACLCDFGLSRFLIDNTLWKTTATHAGGTVRWMAPELMNEDQPTPTKESDIYAYAMTCYEILSGGVPFKSVANDIAIPPRVMKGQRPNRMESFDSDFMWDIITRCWAQEPKDRLPTERVLELLRLKIDWKEAPAKIREKDVEFVMVEKELAVSKEQRERAEEDTESDVTAFIKGGEFIDNNHNATTTATTISSGLQTATPGARMFDNADAKIEGGEFFNANRAVYKIVINSGHDTIPGARMFDNADAKIEGGEFFNANRAVYKIVINSGHDTIETIHAALPFLLEQIRKIQFQSAANGKMGGGGDPVVIEMVEPGPSSSLEIRSVADRYTRSMLKCLTGYPLYSPQPCSDFLKEVYSRKGVCVGDVGIITKDGAFDFLFNICPSQNTLINPPQLPSSFTLEASEEPITKQKEQFPHKTHVFESPVSRTKSLLRDPRYKSSEVGGAILELPEGASQDDATITFPFRWLASRYGEQWYRYTIGTRGKDVLNGSLYLVTSCTKCTQWGIAVFDLPCTPQDSLRFVQNKGFFRDSGSKYTWKGSGAFTTKVGPSEGSNQEDSPNQCVFVQGYKIMLRQDVFINVRNDLLHQPPQASSSTRSINPGKNLTQHPVRAWLDRGGSGPDPGRKRQVQDIRWREPTTNGVMMHTNVNLPPVHPSDLINSALLKQISGAKVALTHDNDWRDLVKDIFNNLENLDLAKIARSYGISTIDENGCVCFGKFPEKSLVIAIDVGTTFSGVSYSLLDPGKKPRIQPVTRFSGQREGQGNSKVPSVVCYDQDGTVIAAGSEADPETNPLLSDMNDVRRAEWFKLRLCLPHLAVDKRAELQKLWSPPEPTKDQAHDEIEDELLLEIEGVGAPIREPEPARRGMHFIPVADDFKSPVQIFSDFLRYLFISAKGYIIEAESNLDPTFSWISVERNIHFVLTHPNGWEEEQRSQMRDAAVAAGLVNMSAAAERITFLTEGEANLHFCLEKNPNLQQERNGLLVVDCGGGTIDLSAYSWREEGFMEIASPGCLLQGSIFVTSRARDYFKGRFKESEFGSDDDVEAMAMAFDKPDGVKCMFSNPNIPYYVKFGDLRDTDRAFGIFGGKFRLEGTQVARFFEPAISDIIDSITDQCNRVKWNKSSIKIILLVGGFGSSSHLYTRFSDHFKPQGISVRRPDSTAQLNKAVADGAVSYYLRHIHKHDWKEGEH